MCSGFLDQTLWKIFQIENAISRAGYQIGQLLDTGLDISLQN